MNILITGSKGFIGSNLKISLEEENYNIIEFVKEDSLELLEEKIVNSNIIFHIAGINRTKDNKLFEKVNVHLTKLICDVLIKNNKKIPIFFSSSIQAGNKTKYGESKLKAEELLKNLWSLNKNPVLIYRLPGVFGKWCKPNYNSVVATFCNSIINNLAINIVEANKEIKLIYIDDLVKSFISEIKKFQSDFRFIKVEPEYKIKVSELAKNIRQFKDSRNSLIINKVSSGLRKKLYATYCSYLSEKGFSYLLKKNSDERGDFVEFLKTIDSGQFSYFTAHPGVTRGGHYHHTKCEKFLIVHGEAKFKFRNIRNDKYFEKIVSSNSPEIVESIPGWVHNVTNIGNEELKVILWSSELFDKENPDTFFSKI